MNREIKIIGLTGNIATGKSVVRHMLSNSGALGLDADWIAHRMLYPEGPAFHPVINTFGESLLSDNGEISRQKLGEIVFSNPQKLIQLENLIHPMVTKSIRSRVEASTCFVAVIEAIKLLESDLFGICNTIWVSHANREVQIKRLMTARGMTKETAEARISAQPSQSEKLNRAEVVINTEGSFRSTWRQIQSALNDTIKLNLPLNTLHLNRLDPDQNEPVNHLLPHRVEDFWRIHSRRDIPSFYETLGMRMILPIPDGDQIQRLLLWDDWNFTAVLRQVLSPDTGWHRTGDVLTAFEADARLKQCEILLLPEVIAKDMQAVAERMDYEKCMPASLPYTAWRQAGDRLKTSAQTHVWAKILAQPFEIEREQTP